MVQLTVPLPADLQRWVDARVAAEGYTDAADYLRELVRRDQDEHHLDVLRVRRLVDEGRASGIVDAEPEDMLAEIMAEIPGAHG